MQLASLHPNHLCFLFPSVFPSSPNMRVQYFKSTAHLSDRSHLCPIIETFIKMKGIIVVNVLTGALHCRGDVKPYKGIKKSKVWNAAQSHVMYHTAPLARSRLPDCSGVLAWAFVAECISGHGPLLLSPSVNTLLPRYESIHRKIDARFSFSLRNLIIKITFTNFRVTYTLISVWQCNV